MQRKIRMIIKGLFLILAIYLILYQIFMPGYQKIEHISLYFIYRCFAVPAFTVVSSFLCADIFQQRVLKSKLEYRISKKIFLYIGFLIVVAYGGILGLYWFDSKYYLLLVPVLHNTWLFVLAGILFSLGI